MVKKITRESVIQWLMEWAPVGIGAYMLYSMFTTTGAGEGKAYEYEIWYTPAGSSVPVIYGGFETRAAAQARLKEIIAEDSSSRQATYTIKRVVVA